MFEREDLRYTPAGIPRIGLKIRHISEQQEAGVTRQVQCDIPVVALGQVAQKAAQFEIGQEVRVEGFLAQRSLRIAQLVLHVENIILKQGA